jgi:hypothetical protein
MTSSKPPSYVPTLTEVVRLPDLDTKQSPDPEWVTQQVLERLMPQLEAMVRQKVDLVLLDLKGDPSVDPKRLQD